MPRRPAKIVEKIPRFLLDAIVVRELKVAGGELVRMVVDLVKGHLYDVRVRTRSICHPLTAVARAGPAPGRAAGDRDVPDRYMAAADRRVPELWMTAVVDP
jgi:hypothetical protein